MIEVPSLWRSRNFLLLFFGRFVSTAGSAIFFIAIVWGAATKLGSVGAISLVLMATAIPSAILSPFAGVLADRKSKKNIIVFTDLASGIPLLIMILFLKVSFFQLWTLISIIFSIQILSTFFSPALQSLIPVIVKDEELSHANALISMSSNFSQLIGMAVGGVLIALFGLHGAIFIDGMSFILSGISEIFIVVDEKRKRPNKSLRKIFSDVKEGFGVVFKKPELGGLITIEAIVDFFGTPIFIFLPVIVSKYLDVGATQYGIMQAAMGVGTVLASILFSFIPEPRNKYSLLAIMTFLLGACLIFIGVKPIYFVVLFSLLSIGFLAGIANVIQNVILQRNSPENTRGRVFSFRSTLNSGMRPLSYGFAGLMSTFFPITDILIFFGIASGLPGFFYFFVRRKVSQKAS